MSIQFSFIILILCFPQIFSILTLKHILCNQSISIPPLDRRMSIKQNISIEFCNITFHASISVNEIVFSKNFTIDKQISMKEKRHFSYYGSIINEEKSIVSLVTYPRLQIYIYFNNTYYYYISLNDNSTVMLNFSQRTLLQYYPQLVNDNLWRNLQIQEENYQQNSLVLHDLHFIYELLTLRCESDKSLQYMSFCSLALFIDRSLYENVFHKNIYYVYTFIQHFNFLLRTLTNNQYGGFLLKHIELVEYTDTNVTSPFDLLHNLSTNANASLKNYCLAHQMFLTNTENENHVLGYQASVHTYDVGGICSQPFYINNDDNENVTEEINVNTGLSILNDNIMNNISLYFNGLMKTSYLFFRQMGLNLTLCSMNSTRRSFFQFSTDSSPSVQNCIDLISSTLHPALKRRAHLCFNHINLNNLSSQTLKQDVICKQSIDLQSSVPVGGKHQKTPYIDNALNNNRRGQWFEGNIVGMIIVLSLVIWIPVSCFVHFCVDEINKRTFTEKQQSQEMEALPVKSSVIEQANQIKQTQTDESSF